MHWTCSYIDHALSALVFYYSLLLSGSGNFSLEAGEVAGPLLLFQYSLGPKLYEMYQIPDSFKKLLRCNLFFSV